MQLNQKSADFYHEFFMPHPVLGIEAESAAEWVIHSKLKWKNFSNNFSKSDKIAILDGAIFQCGIGELLEYDAGFETITDFIDTVIDEIKKLNPILIYLYQDDIESSLREISAQRPKSWLKRVESIFEKTPYGSSRPLKGFDLYLDFNISLRNLSDSIYDRINIRKIKIKNSDKQWNQQMSELCDFLKLRQFADPFNPLDYVGEYSENGGSRSCFIQRNNGYLSVEGLFKIFKNLLPKYNDTFFVQTWPDELTFYRDKSGRVESFKSTGYWNRIGENIWKRVSLGK